MKKIFLGVCSIALIAGTMTSCGKTTKGKISEEWNVVKIENNSTYVGSNGQTSTSTNVTTVSGSTLTDTYTSNGTAQTSTGTVTAYNYIINKDGTFESNQNITYVEQGSTYTIVSKSTGTWSFVGKNKTDEFKKNERVVFNTLSYTYTETYGGTSDTSSGTYAVGESSDIYTVVESTGKTLVLTSNYDNKSTNTTGGSSSTSSSKGTTTITLEKS